MRNRWTPRLVIGVLLISNTAVASDYVFQSNECETMVHRDVQIYIDSQLVLDQNLGGASRHNDYRAVVSDTAMTFTLERVTTVGPSVGHSWNVAIPGIGGGTIPISLQDQSSGQFTGAVTASINPVGLDYEFNGTMSGTMAFEGTVTIDASVHPFDESRSGSGTAAGRGWIHDDDYPASLGLDFDDKDGIYCSWAPITVFSGSYDGHSVQVDLDDGWLEFGDWTDTSIPEPATLSLLALGGSVVVRRRRTP